MKFIRAALLLTVIGGAAFGQCNNLQYNALTSEFNCAGAVGVAKVGTIVSLPATCTVGQLYFASNATPGQQIYMCSATDTWTQQLNSGSGGASTALDNLASVSINAALLFQAAKDVGSTTKPARNIFFYGAGTYSSTYLELTGTPTSTRVWTFPDTTDTVVGKATTDTLTNKTLTAPVMTTPTLGDATATTVNKVTITAPATGSTLTIPDGVTLTGPSSSATVATLGLTNTFTGRQAAGGAASTQPLKTGTSLPGTCIVGDLFFKSDATAGQNIYQCQTTNTWTQQLNSGGGTVAIQVDGVAIGNATTLNIKTGTGSATAGVDAGSGEIDVTIGPSQSLMVTTATAQSITAKKTFVKTSNVAALNQTPTTVPSASLASGDEYINSTTFLKGIYNGSAFQYGLATTATPCTASQLVVGTSTSGLYDCVATTGTGSGVLASSPTIVTPVIASLVNANHTHANAAGGGALTGALFDSWTDWTAISTPANPASGHIKVYALTGCAGGLATLTSAGSETCLGSGGSSIDTLTGTGSGASAGVQVYNTTATTGVSLLHIRNGAANESGGHPYSFSVYKNDNSTFLFGVGDLGVFSSTLNLCDENATYPCQRILTNSEGAIDFVSEGFTGNAGHGAFNFEMNADATQTSGTASYLWLDSNSHHGFAPASGTAIWNGLWVPTVINQTGGANGITRGVFIDNVLTAAADFRGMEISNVGTTQTSILTGTGKIILGGLKTTGAATGKTVVCVDTSTGQLYASTSGVACAN